MIIVFTLKTVEDSVNRVKSNKDQPIFEAFCVFENKSLEITRENDCVVQRILSDIYKIEAFDWKID